jgi:hypothetical protein
MHITLTPARSDVPRRLHRAGDVLTVDGERFDFSGLPDGATLPRDAVQADWLASDVERVAGVLRLTVILPHGADAPDATRFPAPVIDPPDGDIALPPHDLARPDPTPPTPTPEDGHEH